MCHDQVHAALTRHEPEDSNGLVTSFDCLELFMPEGCRLYSDCVPRDVIIACSHSGM
jgi:hypothetical protein